MSDCPDAVQCFYSVFDVFNSESSALAAIRVKRCSIVGDFKCGQVLVAVEFDFDGCRIVVCP